MSLPIVNHYKLSTEQSPKIEKELIRMNKIPYANDMGYVMYIMICTRLDLAYAISVLQRFMSNLGKGRRDAIIWLLRYL